MKTRHIVSAVLLALPGALAAQPNCGIPSRHVAAAADSLVPVERLLAQVGDRFILCSEFWPQYRAALKDQGRDLPDSAMMMKELREMLDGMVDRELLVYLALQQNLDFPAEDIERATDAQISKIRGSFTGTEQEFMNELHAAGFSTLDSYRKYYAEQMRRENLPMKLIQELRKKGQLPSAPVPDSIVDAQVPLLRASRGQKPVTVSFRQIFLTTQAGPRAELAARARAESLLVRLQKGEDFETMAKTESADSATRSQGGDLGWQRRGKFYPDFERFVFTATPGQLSPVIRTPFGYHIARVDRVQAAEVKSRHILIRPEVDSADAARNTALADSVVKLLRAGANFDSIADKYGDPSLKSQRSIPSIRRDSLELTNPDYAAAMKDLKPGEISAPFRIPDNRSLMPTYVIVVLTAVEGGGEYTDTELREEIRRSMQSGAAVRAYLDRMRKQVYIRIFL